MLTVANFNMHAGIDGWGRPFDFVAACRDLGTDVIVLEEAWRGEGDGPEGQAEQIARSLGYEVATCTLAEGRRIRPDPGATDRWMPRFGLRSSKSALYFESERPVSPAAAASARYAEAERGSWGIAVLTRRGMTVDDVRVLHLPHLPRERVRRAAIVVDVTVQGHPVSVIGTHMSHLQFGSHRHYALLRKRLRTEARPDAVLLGDMNLWGPPVRAFLREWHRAVKGQTWPSDNPHSQIDHILVRGEMQIATGEVLPAAGSDHRPVRAELTLR